MSKHESGKEDLASQWLAAQVPAAIACASIKSGFLNQQIEVEFPGGILQIEWSGNDDDDVILTGPAVEVFEDEWK